MENAFNKRQKKNNKRTSIEEQKIEMDNMLSKKNNNDQFIPTPVFDEFLRAFIITR